MYEGKHSITFWLFLWEGEYITFEQHSPVGQKVAEHHFKLINIIKKIDMPSAVKLRQKEMFSDLKEAMDEDKGMGIFASSKNVYEIELDLSEVI